MHSACTHGATRIAAAFLVLAVTCGVPNLTTASSPPDKIRVLSARQTKTPFNPALEANASATVVAAVRASDGLASESNYRAAATRYYLQISWTITAATPVTVVKRVEIVPPFQFVDLPVGGGSGTKRFVRIATEFLWNGLDASGACVADGNLDSRFDIEFIREKDTGAGTKTKEIDRADPVLSATVVIVGTAPVLSITAPQTGLITRVASVTVSGSVSSLLSTTVKVAGQPVQLTGGNFSAVVGLAEGSNEVAVTATDCAARSATRSVSVVLDSIPATVRIDRPADGTIEKTATPDIRVSYSDTGSGVAPSSVRVMVSGVDRTAEFDVGPTAATLKSGASLGLSDGAHQIFVVLQDNAGNQSQAAASILVDTTPPTAKIDSPASGAYVNQKSPPISISYSDAGSGVTTSSIRITVAAVDRTSSFLITPSKATLKEGVDLALSEGSVTVAATVFDRAGHRADASSTFIVDTIPAELTIASPVPAFVTAATPIRATGEIRDSSPIAKFTINGTAVVLSNGSFTADVPLAEGAVTLVFCLADAAGNVTVRFVKGTYDAHPPQLTFTSPTDGALFKTEPITVTGTVFDQTRVTVIVNGVVATMQGASYSALVPLVQGSNLLQVVARDEAGLEATAERTVVLDLDKPSISIVVPAHRSTLTTETPEMLVTYHNGESGIASGSFKALLDNQDVTGAFQASDSQARWAVPADKALSAGQHTLICEVADRAGNVSQIESVFEVSIGPPPPPVTATSGFARGRVLDGSGAPLSGARISIQGYDGVVLSRSDGSFDIPTPGPGEFLLNITKPGFTLAQRRVKAVKGRESAVAPAYLIPLGPKTLVSSVSGGTVTDPTGHVQLIIPPGALRQDTEIQATDLPRSQVLPGPLPANSKYLSAFDIQPSMTFAVPVTVRYKLRTKFPAGTGVPLGYYHTDTGTWCHDTTGVVLSDGLTYEAQLTHASTYDGNFAVTSSQANGEPVGLNHEGIAAGEALGPPPPVPGTLGPNQGFVPLPPSPRIAVAAPAPAPTAIPAPAMQATADPPPSVSPCACTQTSGFFADNGAFQEEYVLPPTPDAPFPLMLVYRSDTAQPRPLIHRESMLDSLIFNPATIQAVTAELAVGGEFHEIFFKPRAGESAFRFLWEAKDRTGNYVTSGSYPYNLRFANHFNERTYAQTLTFGDAPRAALPVRTLEPVPRYTNINGRLRVVNRRKSPFGVGWGLNILNRLHIDPDGPVLLEEGGGSSIVFTPGTVLYSATFENQRSGLTVVDTTTNRHLSDFKFHFDWESGVSNNVLSLALSPDRSFAYVSTKHQYIYKVAPPKHQPEIIFKHPGLGRPFSTDVRLAPTPDGRKLFLALHQGFDCAQMELLDLTTKAREILIRCDESLRKNISTDVQLSRDGNRAFIVTYAELGLAPLLIVLDLTVRPVAQQRIPLPTFLSGAGLKLALSPDNRLAAICGRSGWGGGLVFLDISGAVPQIVGTISGQIRDVAFTPGGDRVLASTDVGVFIYNLTDVNCGPAGNATVEMRFPGVGGVMVMPDGSGAYVAGPYEGLSTNQPPSPNPFDTFGSELYFLDLAELKLNTVTPRILVPGGGGVVVSSPNFFTSPRGEFSSLERLPSGEYRRLRSNGLTELYSSSGLQLERRALSGRIWKYQYDEQDRLITLVHPANEGETRFLYGSGGIQSIINASGRRITTLDVDSAGHLVSITQPSPATPRTFGYDPLGRMVRVEHAQDDVSTITYDARGLVTEIVAHGGMRNTITPQHSQGLANALSGNSGSLAAPTGQLADTSAISARYTTPDGGTWSYTLNSYGQAMVAIDPTGAITRLFADASGLVRKMVDAKGRETTYDYDVDGAHVSTKLPGGEVFSVDLLKLGGASLPVRSKLPSGASVSVDYDSRGLPTKVTDATGASSLIEHLGSAKLARVQQPDTKTIFIDYSSFGAPQTVRHSPTPTGDGAATWTSEFDADRNVTAMTDPHGRRASGTYDNRGLPLTITDSTGGTTRLAFDGQGQLTSAVDGNGNATAASWSHNRLTSIRNALGQETSFAYTQAGRLSEVTTFRGEKTRLVHDLLGRPVELTDPLGRTSTITYDAFSDIADVRDPSGRIFKTERDVRRRVTAAVAPDGTRRTFAYSSDGPLSAITDELGRTIKFERDAAGRLTGLVDPSGASVRLQRDIAGRVIKRTDRLGRSIEYSHDSFGRPSTTKLPDGSVYTLIYDIVGDLIKVTSPRGGQWSYTYDGNHRVTAAKDPLGAEWRYRHDAGGRLVELDAPGEGGTRIVTRTSYDALNRPVRVAADDKVTTVSYLDAQNKTIFTIAPDGTTIEKSFDAIGRLTEERTSTSVATTVVSYEYDATSNLVAVGLNGVTGLRCEYDSRNRPIKITDARRGRSFTLSYTLAGELKKITYPSGVTRTNDWGSRGELRSTTYARGTSVLYFRSYSYDAELQITAISDGTDALASYQYDALGRLKRADYRGGGFESWSYDLNGNIATYQTSGGLGARSETRQHDAADGLSRIDSVGASGVATVTMFTLDVRGNVVRQSKSDGEVHELSWDSQNWLRQVKTNGQVKLEAAYLDDYRLATLKLVFYSAARFSDPGIWSQSLFCGFSRPEPAEM